MARPKSVTDAMVHRAYRDAAEPQAPEASSFRIDDFVVYPAHGVGCIEHIGPEDIAGYRIEMVRIRFADTQMILRVPVRTAVLAGLRPLATEAMLAAAMTTLKGRARGSRAVWSRRAKEYQDRINTGDLQTLAEVARDLHRPASGPPSSHSQRALFELAMDRLAGECAAIARIDKSAATMRLEHALSSKTAEEKTVGLDQSSN